MIQIRGRILVQCVLHSKPGTQVTATIKVMGKDVLALCPFCISLGGAIREGSKIRMESVSPEELKNEMMQGAKEAGEKVIAEEKAREVGKA